MIKEAIEKILSLADVKVIDHFLNEDRMFTTSPIYPVLEPVPATLTGSTLHALVDYVKYEFDVSSQIESFIHIENHRKVSFISPIFGGFNQRYTHYTVTHEVKEFHYGQYMDIESFIVGIQSFFIQDENTAAILQIAGNVTHDARMDVNDNGYTQTVTAKTGIARVGNVPVPNPVTLRPYRTFLEVENQPSCLFVFRMRQTDNRPECALFEADSGLWKLEAIKEIKSWLMDNAPAIEIIG